MLCSEKSKREIQLLFQTNLQGVKVLLPLLEKLRISTEQISVNLMEVYGGGRGNIADNTYHGDTLLGLMEQTIREFLYIN